MNCIYYLVEDIDECFMSIMDNGLWINYFKIIDFRKPKLYCIMSMTFVHFIPIIHTCCVHSRTTDEKIEQQRLHNCINRLFL